MGKRRRPRPGDPYFTRDRVRRYMTGTATYGVEPPAPPDPIGPRACSTRREGDEDVCHCGLRWNHQEDRPACPHQGSY